MTQIFILTIVLKCKYTNDYFVNGVKMQIVHVKYELSAFPIMFVNKGINAGVGNVFTLIHENCCFLFLFHKEEKNLLPPLDPREGTVGGFDNQPNCFFNLGHGHGLQNDHNYNDSHKHHRDHYPHQLARRAQDFSPTC